MPAVDDDLISNSALSRVSKPHHPYAVNNILASLSTVQTKLRLSHKAADLSPSAIPTPYLLKPT
jgi:hypothetical protein